MEENINANRQVFSRLPFLMAARDPKMSQKQLATALNLSPTTINKLYNGQPLTARIDPAVVAKLCNYFNCQVGDLLVMEVGDP